MNYKTWSPEEYSLIVFKLLICYFLCAGTTLGADWHFLHAYNTFMAKRSPYRRIWAKKRPSLWADRY